MNAKIVNVLPLFILLICSSCHNYFYVANKPMVATLKNKNEIHVELNAQSSSSPSSSTVTTDNMGNTVSQTKGGESTSFLAFGMAYSPIKNWIVQYNQFGVNYKSDSSNYGRLKEIGAGYYYSIDKNWYFQCLAIAGFGKVNLIYKPEFVLYNLHKTYLQPSISAFARHWEFSAGMKIGTINYSVNRESNYTTLLQNSTNISEKNLITNYMNNPFMEPFVMVKFGWKYLKFEIAMSSSTFSHQLDNNILRNNYSLSLLYSDNLEKIKSKSRK